MTIDEVWFWKDRAAFYEREIARILANVRAVHRARDWDGYLICDECDVKFPCRTIEAIS